MSFDGHANRSISAERSRRDASVATLIALRRSKLHKRHSSGDTRLELDGLLWVPFGDFGSFGRFCRGPRVVPTGALHSHDSSLLAFETRMEARLKAQRLHRFPWAQEIRIVNRRPPSRYGMYHRPARLTKSILREHDRRMLLTPTPMRPKPRTIPPGVAFVRDG